MTATLPALDQMDRLLVEARKALDAAEEADRKDAHLNEAADIAFRILSGYVVARLPALLACACAAEAFAKVAEWYGPEESDEFEVWSDYPHGLIERDVAKLKHFRAAAKALQMLESGG